MRLLLQGRLKGCFARSRQANNATAVLAVTTAGPEGSCGGSSEPGKGKLVMLVKTCCVAHDGAMAPSDHPCPLEEYKLPERRVGPTLSKIFSPFLSNGILFSGTNDEIPVIVLRDSGSF